MHKQAEINHQRCLQVAEIITQHPVKQSFYDRIFLHLPTDKETSLRTLLFAVTICHQTRLLVNEDKTRYGWDYIEDVFYHLALNNSSLLSPQWIIKSDPEQLSNAIQSAFSTNNNPKSSTLDRIKERTSLYQEIAIWLTTHYNESLSIFFERTDYKLYNQGRGIYECLQKTTVFGDPQLKKASFFMKLLEDSKLITVSDPQHYLPIMDYHMQRVLLRMGCIEILNTDLHYSLTHKTPQNNDFTVREACIEASKIIARHAKISVLTLNDYFWPLGRSCCNTMPRCINTRCEKEPCSLTQIIETGPHTECLFQSICPGSTNHHYRNLWEPMITTHYY